MKKQIKFVCLVFLLVVTPCLLPAESIKVAAITDMTGPHHLIQKPVLNTIQLAVQQINKNASESGFSIELLEIDSKGTVLGSRIAAGKAVKKEVSAVIGPLRSSAALAAASVLQKAGVVMITPTATHPSITLKGEYIFRTCYTDTFQGKVLAQFAASSLNASTAGVLINAKNRYSTGLAESFRQNFLRLGGKISYQIDYLEKVTDLDKMVRRIQQNQPDVIFIPGYSRDSGTIIKKIRKQGISSLLIGGDGWGTAPIGTYAGDAVEGSFRTSFWHPEIPDEKSRAFVENFKKNHGKIRRYDIATAYEAVMVLAKAARSAKSADPSDIRKSLHEIRDFQGITGSMRFNENGDPVKPTVILTYEKSQPLFHKTVSHETLLTE